MISGVNAGNSFAISEREETQAFVTDTLTYTFNLKAKAADTTNAKIENPNEASSPASNFPKNCFIEASTASPFLSSLQSIGLSSIIVLES